MSSKGSPARLSELIAALSLATDLGLGEPMEHLLRSCLISMRLGERMGLTDAERAEVYYVSLLAWVGCMSDSTEMSALFGDDIRGVPTLLGWMMRHWPCHGFFFGVRDQAPHQ
jgi:hypothetical protein